MGGVGTARSVGGNVALMMVVVVCWIAAFVLGGAAAADGSVESDTAVLRAVVTSNPTFNQSWIGNDTCRWKGVTCEKSRVTRLVLRGLGLSGSIPKELGNLKSLQHLYLYVNQLNGSIPKELGSLTSLKTLDLHYNQLSGSIPKELGSLTSLQTLRLHYNQLSGSIPRELASLTSLQDLLYLYSNQLSGPIPTELDRLRTTIVLGCINHLTTEDLNYVCTSASENGRSRFDLSECQSKCLPSSPKTVAGVLWSAWLGIAAFIGISVFFVSQRCRPPVGKVPDDVNADITKIGICKYAWGLLSLAFILFDVITNLQTLRSLVGSWSLYVVAFLIVWQHLVSGLMLYTKCVRKQSWPLARGLCTAPMNWSWAWDWRRCIIGFRGNRTIGADGRGIQRATILHILLWPLGLVYVVVLDVLSLLSLKIGIQLRVGTEWVNLQTYWESRELTDALLQALPQAVFQTVLMVVRADPKETKIRITTSQFVLSLSSSLGSVIAVLAMTFWEARMKRQNVVRELWHQFKGILPAVRDDGPGF